MSQLLFAIGLVTFSIFIHELGHFLVARWRGLVVPRFSIFGIGKPIVSWKWRGVEYCICWLPIGAYVMVPQLSDLGDFEGELPPDLPPMPPADYLSKVLVAIAGPLSNILLALFLACIVWIVGVKVPVEFNRTEIGEVTRELVTSDGNTVPGPAAVAGVQPGDIIRKIDGKPVANYEDVLVGIILGAEATPDERRVVTLTLERNGVLLTKQVFPVLTGSERFRNIGIGARSDLIIEKIGADTPAAQAGLREGDHIVSVDGQALRHREELRQHFQKKNAEPSSVVIKRGDTLMTIALQPKPKIIDGRTLYLIGIEGWKIETVLIHPTPLAQIGKACEQIYRTFASLANRRSDIGVRHMSSVIGIVDNLQQAASAGLIHALAFLLVINISLAIFNLLPIPVLDGGHILIATLTKLRGRPPNPIWMQKTVAACFLMLVGLIVYVSYHDIRRRIPSMNVPAKPAGESPRAPSGSEPAPTK
jgi:regulator of sigma E protease